MKFKKNKPNNDVYTLCFKDFNKDKMSRKPCKFLKIINKTSDTKEDIAKKFGGISTGTKILKTLGVSDGLWGLVAICNEKEIDTLNYDDIGDI